MRESVPIPVAILHDFAARVDRLEISYMLTGSFAMMYYQYFRMTADIDVVVELDILQVNDFVSAFEDDFYVMRETARNAVRSNRMFNIIHTKTAFKIDCAPVKNTEFHRNAFARRKCVDFLGRQISIISREDLIIAKLWWAKDSYSEKQLDDVSKLMTDEVDATYVSEWSEKLKLSELLKKTG